MLGRRFSLSFAKVESMSNELQYVNKEINELNVNLEKKVHERTIELEQAKNLIERASQEKSLFFTNIAHEIKTPLTLIHNYLNSYIEKAGLNNDLKVIRQNFQKMLNDMLNFLDAEKLDKGNIFYNHDQIINLSDIIKEKIELLKTNASKKYILLTDDIESDLYIKSEPQAIERIINNLADNSIKYTNNGGKIHIKLIGKNNKVFLSVKDTGIGISEEMQEKIFKPYYQLSNNKQNVQGIGMGLFIVKKTVESLNGKILLESEPIKGSTFTVVLDKYNAETDEIISNDLNNTDNTLTSRRINIDNYDNFIVKPNILIIEDNSDMADFLSDYFSNTYNVYSGKNGKDALAKLKVIPMPEIIITDIMMNEIDGFEFIEYLYSNDKYKNIPVVFLTAKTTLKSKIEGLKKGAVDYIYKPFEIEELSMKINSIINNRRHQKVQDKEKIKKYLIKSLADFENETESKNNKNNESNNYEIHKEKIMNNKNISDREKEVINLLVKGLQHKEIASQLNISVKTVENHISKIYKKFNVENKVELMNSLINNLNF